LDGSGHLSVSELSAAIHLFLNGVDKHLVDELVQRYDVDGDGHISLEEFSGFLMSRNDEDPSKWMRVDHLAAPHSGASTPLHTSRPSPRTHRQAYEEEHVSTSGSGVQYEAKMYLQHLKGHLTKQTLDKRGAGKISFNERKSHKTSHLIKVQARTYIRKLFAQYVAPPGPNDPASSPRGVSFDSFKRVLKRVVIPGMKPVSDDVLDFVAANCAFYNHRDEELASPEVFVDLLFDEGEVTRNQFGFTKEVNCD
jgi:hypothetical protein